ncbi:3863_t:CDS:2, partial [Paraglomus occultum]
MSQQPFQTWQSHYKQRQESAQQQQHRHTVNPATSTTDRAYYWDGSKYVYYKDLQAGSQPRQDQSSLSHSQTTMFTAVNGLPTYSSSQLANQQQSQTYIDDSNLAVHQHLLTNSIQQQNDSALSARQGLITHREQHQQQWLSQYPYSRHREVQTPSELITPMQSEHQLDRQNSVQDMLGVVPVESSENVQSQVYPQTEIISHPSQGSVQNNFNQSGNGFPDQSSSQMETDDQVISRQQDESNISAFNVLMKSGIAKITDFGLSGQMMSSSLGEGTAAYRDPLSFRNQPYKRGKKSDIFSLGVLFWEISSEQIPCKKWTNVAKCREEGYRDSPLPETPDAYVQLYSACWSENAEERPSCTEIHKQLQLLSDDRNQHLP